MSPAAARRTPEAPAPAPEPVTPAALTAALRELRPRWVLVDKFDDWSAREVSRGAFPMVAFDVKTSTGRAWVRGRPDSHLAHAVSTYVRPTARDVVEDLVRLAEGGA